MEFNEHPKYVQWSALVDNASKQYPQFRVLVYAAKKVKNSWHCLSFDAAQKSVELFKEINTLPRYKAEIYLINSSNREELRPLLKTIDF
jgi:hypothetical protein